MVGARFAAQLPSPPGPFRRVDRFLGDAKCAAGACETGGSPQSSGAFGGLRLGASDIGMCLLELTREVVVHTTAAAAEMHVGKRLIVWGQFEEVGRRLIYCQSGAE